MKKKKDKLNKDVEEATIADSSDEGLQKKAKRERNKKYVIVPGPVFDGMPTVLRTPQTRIGKKWKKP